MNVYVGGAFVLKVYEFSPSSAAMALQVSENVPYILLALTQYSGFPSWCLLQTSDGYMHLLQQPDLYEGMVKIIYENISQYVLFILQIFLSVFTHCKNLFFVNLLILSFFRFNINWIQYTKTAIIS